MDLRAIFNSFKQLIGLNENICNFRDRIILKKSILIYIGVRKVIFPNNILALYLKWIFKTAMMSWHLGAAYEKY